MINIIFGGIRWHESGIADIDKMDGRQFEFTEPAKNLTRSNNVKLMGRRELGDA
jgi:HJR/Mrr/RecB family endonuclease